MSGADILSPGTVWIDYLPYASALLRPGDDVWKNAGQFAHFAREAQALLNSSVIDINLDAFTQSWLGRERASLDLGDDGVEAVKAVLGHQDYRAALKDILAATEDLARSADGFTLTLSGPSVFAGLIVEAAGHGSADIEEEDIDMAILHLTDALRQFTAYPLCALMFDDPEPVEEIYEPLLNVAHDYEWLVGIRGTEDAEGFDFLVTEQAPASATPWGKWIKDLNTDSNGETPAFLHWSLSAGLSPEDVLAARKNLAKSQAA